MDKEFEEAGALLAGLDNEGPPPDDMPQDDGLGESLEETSAQALMDAFKAGDAAGFVASFKSLLELLQTPAEASPPTAE